MDPAAGRPSTPAAAIFSRLFPRMMSQRVGETSRCSATLMNSLFLLPPGVSAASKRGGSGFKRHFPGLVGGEKQAARQKHPVSIGALHLHDQTSVALSSGKAMCHSRRLKLGHFLCSPLTLYHQHILTLNVLMT